MPCTMMDGVDWASVDAQDAKKKADEVSRLLCGLMKALEDRGFELSHLDDLKLVEWWKAHKKHDKTRSK